MCGIAGAVGSVDARVLEAVRAADAAQKHRGPDGHGLWTDAQGARVGKVAFAHRRLAILDLTDHAAQPMRDPATGCVLCYNGEVYNFPALRKELEAAGHTFESTGDTEVVLRAWIEWGEGMVERLAGMFAFAIWDPRTEQVFLARDRLGIKPLYYAEVDGPSGKAVLFASELRALLASGLVCRRIDRAGLASYLWHGFVFGPSTLVEGVTLLPGGASLTLRPGAATPGPKPFWTLPRYEGGAYASTAQLEASLRQAVERRLVSDVPLGVFLSGGIDSSAVAAMASAEDPGRVHTFNVYFEESKYDESRYAEAVAKALGTRHTPILLTGDSFKAHLDDAFSGIDQPTFDGLNSYFVSRAVREAGVTVALAGTGGDELFGGYTSFVDVPKVARVAGRVRGVPKPLLHALARGVRRVKTGKPGVLPPQTRWGKLGDVLGTAGDLARAYQVSYGIYTQDLLPKLMPGYEAAGTVYGIPKARFEQFADSASGRQELDAISAFELQSFVTERLMRDTDAASMAVSLEVRVPLLDHDLIDAVSHADPEARYLPIRKKMLLRHLALRKVDPAIFDRPKSGFEMPFEVWCRNTLRDDIHAVMHDAELVRSAGLAPEPVAKVWQAIDSGAPGFHWSRLWSLYTLLRWCRTHSVSV